LNSDRTSVSVVIPTYRRPELLTRCLFAISQQSLERTEYEIVVADDEMSPRTRYLVAAQAAELGLRMQYVESKGRGPAAARNAGIRSSVADIVAFTDDDTVPDRLWLEEGLLAMTPGVDAVWGRVRVPLRQLPTDYEKNVAQIENAGFVTANCFCRKAALNGIGGFDERFSMAWREDTDLFFRLYEQAKRRGTYLSFASGAVVVHPVRPSNWGISLWQQKKNVFNALLFKKHPELYRKFVQKRAKWFYYAICACLGLFIAGLVMRIGWFSLLALLAWSVMTGAFIAMRLEGTTKSIAHVSEMLVTSALIPPLSIFWRIVGAIRFGRFYP
jgi:cellulose synthase/poly-beta-1,6-N-acetylglucosamine synthase-like glycosyltransferase